jgi:CelD/BcsL family acetyltransferase involved in cellulose biosynthesis
MMSQKTDFTELSLHDPSAMKEWDSFVFAHPSGTSFHLSPWIRTIEQTYHFEPVLRCWRTDRGELAAVFPLFKIRQLWRGKRLVSLPYSDYGGPLWIQSDPEVAFFQKPAGRKGEERSASVEIRGMVPASNDLIRHDYYIRHILDLDRDLAELQQSIDRRTIQYSIRKAEKAGVVIKEAGPEQGLREFIRLNRLTRKKHGVPSQPQRWFVNLSENMIRQGLGFILLAEWESAIIGASLFLTCGKVLHYKYNASDPAMMRRVSPNHLLTWSAIKWGIEHRYKALDFGRTAPDNIGLMRYKRMWGCVEQGIPYFYYPKIKGAASKEEKGLPYRLFTRIWRSLPDGLAERLSPVVFKRLA